MRSWKAAVAVVAPLAAVAAAAYGSAYAINLFLGLDDQPVGWDNAWRYYHALDQPRVAPYAWGIKLGITAGCALPLLACCAVWAKLLKHRSTTEPTHGDARFATLADGSLLGGYVAQRQDP